MAAHIGLQNQDNPISSVPIEILNLIFVCAKQMIRASATTSYFNQDPDADSETSSKCSVSSHPTPFEITISHVCSYWRNVVIHQPLLWTDIRIFPHTSLDEVATYLKRSRDCLLDFHLNIGQSNVTSNGAQMLIANVARWRNLIIDFDGQVCQDIFLAQVQNLNAPNLIHLSINANARHHLESMPKNVNSPHPQIFANGAPALSFVRLRCHAIAFFRPPLTNLVTLHLDQTSQLPMSFALFCHVVTASPSLANLSIYGDMIGTARWPMTNSIEMSALRSLRICGVSGFIYTGLLLSISAPRLESLVLKGVLHHDLDELLVSSQMPKFPRLHHLTFCDFECTEWTYKKIFRAFPTVREFISLHSGGHQRLLGLIGEMHEDTSSESDDDHPRSLHKLYLPWPSLQTISFLFVDTGDEASIVKMIDTRLQLVHPITKLRLGTGSTDQNPRRLALGNWLREHVEVEIFHEMSPWPVGWSDFDEDDVLF